MNVLNKRGKKNTVTIATNTAKSVSTGILMHFKTPVDWTEGKGQKWTYLLMYGLRFEIEITLVVGPGEAPVSFMGVNVECEAFIGENLEGESFIGEKVEAEFFNGRPFVGDFSTKLFS